MRAGQRLRLNSAGGCCFCSCHPFAYAATKAGVEAIMSFDRHFDKTDLPRVEPADALRLAGIADADRLAKRRA